jgi:quinolinate synthase
MQLWPASCVVHEAFSLQKLLALKARHPEAKIIAHPECEEQLLAQAEFIGSTAGLIDYAENDPATKFLVVTESGILHEMRKRMPAKIFIAAPPDTDCACNNCPYMRKNTPEKVLLALRDLAPALDMPEELRCRAQKPIDRMLELS